MARTVHLGRVEGGVAQELHQHEVGPTIKQVVHSEGVTELVWMAVWDTCHLTQLTDDLAPPHVPREVLLSDPGTHTDYQTVVGIG
ncbi:MAG TPA: hypothetical protein VF043_12960 [Ktedonobacteraceae bacterium]